jgi:dihydrodipicolinate synthase/N-acetylneuraminate lyase
MLPLTWDKINGNWATLLLPINSDDSIDYGKLEDEIDYLIKANVNGIYSNGTAGEFYSQSEEEFERINTILAQKCDKADMPFMIGASHMSPQISLQRLKKAVSLKPGAIQVVLPDWFPANDRASIEFLKVMAEEAKTIGLVLYNPPHAKRVLQPKDYAVLKSAIPSIVGIKTAGGDDDWYREIKQCLPNVSIFIPGHFMASGIMKGAHGSYSNVALLSPIGIQKWNEIIKTDQKAALEIEAKILEFMNKYIQPYITEKGYPNHACDKLMAVIGGWAEIGTRLRWPYSWIPQTDADELRLIAYEMLPELF